MTDQQRDTGRKNNEKATLGVHGAKASIFRKNTVEEVEKMGYELYDYYKGKSIDSETYAAEKARYGLSESVTVYYDGYPASERTLKLIENEVVYQYVDSGMGRANSTTYSFDSEGEALAWMIYTIRRDMNHIKNDEHLRI